MPKLSKLSPNVSCIGQLLIFLKKELLRHFEGDQCGLGFLKCGDEDVEDFFGSKWVLGFILNIFLKKTNRADRKVLCRYANQGVLPRLFFALDPYVTLEDIGKKQKACMKKFWKSCSDVARHLRAFGHEDLSIENLRFLSNQVKSPYDWIYNRIIQIVECFGLRKVNDVASQFILRRKLRIDDLYCEISPELQALYEATIIKQGKCDLAKCRTHMVLEAVYGHFWPKMAMKKKTLYRLCNPNTRISIVMKKFLGPQIYTMEELLL